MILLYTHSCKNLTFTVHAIWNSQGHSIIHPCNLLSMYIGSTCLHCKSNRIALKYFTFTATLANAIVSTIAVQSAVVVWLPEYHTIAPAFIKITFPEVDLAVSRHPAKSESENLYKVSYIELLISKSQSIQIF